MNDLQNKKAGGPMPPANGDLIPLDAAPSTVPSPADKSTLAASSERGSEKFFYLFHSSDRMEAKYVAKINLYLDEDGKVIWSDFEHQHGADPAVVTRAIMLSKVQQMPMKQIRKPNP